MVEMNNTLIEMHDGILNLRILQVNIQQQLFDDSINTAIYLTLTMVQLLVFYLFSKRILFQTTNYPPSNNILRTHVTGQQSYFQQQWSSDFQIYVLKILAFYTKE